jgi:hypothetical protein
MGMTKKFSRLLNLDSLAMTREITIRRREESLGREITLQRTNVCRSRLSGRYIDLVVGGEVHAKCREYPHTTGFVVLQEEFWCGSRQRNIQLLESPLDYLLAPARQQSAASFQEASTAAP